MSIAASEVVFDRDAFIAEVAFDACGWTVLIFVLEPFASAEFDDSAAVAFDVRGVDALSWNEILPLDKSAARGLGACRSMQPRG